MRTKFHCPASAVTTISTKLLVSKMGDHTHSNQLLERTIKGIQMNHVKMAAAAATAVPRIILGEITAEIENKLRILRHSLHCHQADRVQSYSA
jgi:hypothetical protein